MSGVGWRQASERGRTNLGEAGVEIEDLLDLLLPAGLFVTSTTRGLYEREFTRGHVRSRLRCTRLKFSLPLLNRCFDALCEEAGQRKTRNYRVLAVAIGIRRRILHHPFQNQMPSLA